MVYECFYSFLYNYLNITGIINEKLDRYTLINMKQHGGYIAILDNYKATENIVILKVVGLENLFSIEDGIALRSVNKSKLPNIDRMLDAISGITLIGRVSLDIHHVVEVEIYDEGKEKLQLAMLGNSPVYYANRDIVGKIKEHILK